MKLIYFALSSLLLGSFLVGQQRVTLNNPVQASSGVTDFQLNSLHFDYHNKILVIELREVGGDRNIVFTFSDDEFDTQLSKFISVALERKIIQQLQTDGKLGPGSVTGAP